MSKKITKDYYQENIEKWINYLIRKIEEENINQEQILKELKELRKYYFNKNGK